MGGSFRLWEKVAEGPLVRIVYSPGTAESSVRPKREVCIGMQERATYSPTFMECLPRGRRCSEDKRTNKKSLSSESRVRSKGQIVRGLVAFLRKFAF